MRSARILFATIAAVSAAAPACAQTAPELMKQAEVAVATDPARAAALVGSARGLFVKAFGEDSAQVALADYRLALVRALGGDRAGQLRPMATAADRIAARATTPETRTWAGGALIVTASFTMTVGDAALTDRMRDAGLAMLDRGDLAQTAELAEAWRVAADVLAFQNRQAEAAAWAGRAVALYDRVAPDDPGLTYALGRRGSALQRLSRYGEALADLRRAVAHADGTVKEDPFARLYALRSLGNYFWRSGEPALALPLMIRALEGARGLPPGFPYAGGLSRDVMQVLIDSDRDAEARSYAEEAAARARTTMGAKSYEYASALLTLARLDVAAGDLNAARGRIDDADGIFAGALVADNTRRFEPVAARADWLAAQGQGRAAAELYDRAAAIIAATPLDDTDRIDLSASAAAAHLSAATATPAGWHAARAAADGLTTRIVRQAAGAGVIDASRRRVDRVYGVALDTAWAMTKGRRAR